MDVTLWDVYPGLRVEEALVVGTSHMDSDVNTVRVHCSNFESEARTRLPDGEEDEWLYNFRAALDKVRNLRKQLQQSQQQLQQAKMKLEEERMKRWEEIDLIAYTRELRVDVVVWDMSTGEVPTHQYGWMICSNLTVRRCIIYKSL
jgi:hypothetical protein